MSRNTGRSRRKKNNKEEQEHSQDAFFLRAPKSAQQKGDTAFFQAKFSIGQPNDKYEKEADSVANSVVNKNSAQPIQQKQISSIQRLSTSKEEERMGTNEARMAKDKELQEKPIQPMTAGEEKEKPDEVQKKGSGSMQMKQESNNNSTGPALSSRIENSEGKGIALPGNTLQQMGKAFGLDFSNVKIHNDTEAAKMNMELNAQAFTHGNDIYFNEGKFDPEHSQGKNLLAHELTHVVQQGQNASPGIQPFGETAVSNARSLTGEGNDARIFQEDDDS